MSDSARRNPLLLIATAAVVAFGTGAIGAALTDIGEWYYALQQPDWAPPEWLFGPAWTTIYLFCIAAVTLAWRAPVSTPSRAAFLTAWGINVVLNILWSAVFFSMRRPDLALYELVLLWLSVAWLTKLTFSRSSLAGYLMLPYLFWVTFAGLLNFAVVRLNGPFG